MTRSQCDKLSADVLRIYSDMEDEILRMIAAQIGRDGDLSDTSRWRIRQLARSGQMNAKTAALIASYTGVQADAVYDTVLEAAKKEISYLDEAVQAANEKGITEYFSDIPAEDSALFAAQSFQEQAANDLNLVNTVMQYKAKSSYVDAINGIYYDASKRQAALDTMGKGAAMAVSGQTSLQEATRRTIHNLAQKGIPAFVDKRGREWSPEAYVMMDMRSTLANTARAAQDMRCDQYGIQLIVVSSHMGARPKCAPYQGRIFSRDGSSGVTVDGAGNQVKYSPLSRTSYGEPDGLFGINCGHVQYPFIPGVNIQRYFPYNEEQNAQRYEEFQRQRSMERDIKATKRECMMLQAAGDEEGLQKASQKLRQQKQKYNQFCNDKNLGTHYDRTQVYGYDRSKSAKTVWAERKANNSSNNQYKVFAIGEPGSNHTEQFKPFTGVLDKSTKSDIINYGYEKTVTKAVRDRFDKAFEEMTEKFGAITTIRSVEVLNDKSTDFALFEIHSGSIRIRFANKKDCLQRLSAKINSNYKSKKWSSSHQDHIFRHEIGHAIQKQHELTDPLWKEKKDKIISIFAALPEMQDNIDRSVYKDFKVSSYACKNIDDFISECIAESMTKKPRKTATDVVNIILGVDTND